MAPAPPPVDPPDPAGAADPAADAAVLRNVSGLAVVTLAAYGSLRDLPVGGSGAAAVPALRDHLVAGVAGLEATRDVLVRATEETGGAARTTPDPRYAPVVEQVLPTVRGPGDVVGLALTLDDVLAQSLAQAATELSTPARRGLVAGRASAAARRKARLLILQSLLAAGGAELALVPPDLEVLPAEIGAVGFPDVRFPTATAAPVADEGPR